jgi:hypothetical protein
MIVFMGSSFTRGGWDLTDELNEIFLSTIVEKLSAYQTLNLAVPCCGSERYLSTFLYACKHFKPKVFLVETASDRSGSYFYIPNDDTDRISKLPPVEINRIFHTLGISDSGVHPFRLQTFSSPNDTYVREKFRTCSPQINPKYLLDWFNRVSVFNHSFEVKSYKAQNNYISLETLSELMGIPVLYYTYDNGETNSVKPFIDTHLSADRYLNKFYGLPAGVKDYVAEKINGPYLADDSHLTHEGDVLVAKLIIPFIESYCAANGITLDKV